MMTTLLFIVALALSMVTLVAALASLEDEPLFAAGALAATLSFCLWLAFANINDMDQRLQAYEAADTVPAVVDTTGVNDG